MKNFTNISQLGKACLFMLLTCGSFTAYGANDVTVDEGMAGIKNIGELTTFDKIVTGEGSKAFTDNAKTLVASTDDIVKQVFWAVVIYRGLEAYAADYLTLKTDDQGVLSGKLSEVAPTQSETVVDEFWTDLNSKLPTGYSFDVADSTITVKNSATAVCTIETGTDKQGANLANAVNIICEMLLQMHTFVKQVVDLATSEDPFRRENFLFIVNHVPLVTISDDSSTQTKVTIAVALSKAATIISKFIAAAVAMDLNAATTALVQRRMNTDSIKKAATGTVSTIQDRIKSTNGTSVLTAKVEETSLWDEPTQQ